MPFVTIADISNGALPRRSVDGHAALADPGTNQIGRRAAAFKLTVVQYYIR